MKLAISTKKIFNFLNENFYIIIMFIYIFATFFPKISIGIISGILFILIGIFSLINQNGIIKKNIIYIFIIYNLFSIVSILTNNININLYFMGIDYCMLPIILYIVPTTNKIFTKYFWAILWSLIIGYIFFLWAPNFYGNYLANHGYIMYAHQVSTSFQSFYGATTVGTYSACCGLYFYAKWLEKGKNINLLALIISLFTLIVSNRRSAIVGFVLLFIVENLIFVVRFQKHIRKQVILFLIILLICLIWVIPKDFNIILKNSKINRLLDVSTAISERSGNWKTNNKLIKENLLFGTGVGSAGHNATVQGYIAIHDNSYLLIIRELGIVGFLIFILVITKDILKFLKRENKSVNEYVAFLIVLLFMIQAYGSNVWEFPISAALFWKMLSICGNDYSEDK